MSKPSLEQQVRDNVQFQRKTSKTVIPNSSIHSQRQGRDYGWEIQPSLNDQMWGVRVVMPVVTRQTSELKSLFAMMPVSEAVARNYFDTNYLYGEDQIKQAILKLQGGRPRWLPVHLIKLPDPTQNGKDPFTLLVDGAFREFGHKKVRPIVSVEELMRLYDGPNVEAKITH